MGCQNRITRHLFWRQALRFLIAPWHLCWPWYRAQVRQTLRNSAWYSASPFPIRGLWLSWVALCSFLASEDQMKKVCTTQDTRMQVQAFNKKTPLTLSNVFARINLVLLEPTSTRRSRALDPCTPRRLLRPPWPSLLFSVEDSFLSWQCNS